MKPIQLLKELESHRDKMFMKCVAAVREFNNRAIELKSLLLYQAAIRGSIFMDISLQLTAEKLASLHQTLDNCKEYSPETVPHIEKAIKTFEYLKQTNKQNKQGGREL